MFLGEKSAQKPILGADHALYDNKHLLQNDMYSFGILMPGIHESHSLGEPFFYTTGR